MLDSELVRYLIEFFKDPKSKEIDIKGKFYYFPLQSEILKLVNVLHSLIFMKIEGSKLVASGKIKLLIYQMRELVLKHFNYRFYHLNIEQMNKTSVDLFHMYDDLRKSGSSCPNEAELRGYYALLKLDKHPGYVVKYEAHGSMWWLYNIDCTNYTCNSDSLFGQVEPAELSLDLAKMTPEMRNTPDVQFARKVARLED